MSRWVTLLGLVAAQALHAPGIVALRLAATLSATALVCAVGLYAPAVDDALLRASVARDAQAALVQVSQSGAPLDRRGYARLDAYVRRRLAADLALPVERLSAFNSTQPTPIFLAAPDGRMSSRYAGDAALEYYEGLPAHVQVVEGILPRPGLPPPPHAGGAAAAIPVAASFASAQALGLRLGSRVFLSAGRRETLATPLVVAAIYVRLDPTGSFWAANAGPETYHSLTVAGLDAHLALAGANPWLQPKYYWYGQTRLDALRYATAQATLDRVQRAGTVIATIAGGTALSLPLTTDVASFVIGYTLLDPVLYLLVAPVLAVVLYAIAVVAALAVAQREQEVVLLRSRGAGRVQLLVMMVVEALLVGVVAVAAGPLLALPLARLMGRCSGFLQFTAGLSLDLRIERGTFVLAALVVGLATLAAVLPALGVMRRPMAALLRARARPPGPRLGRLLPAGILLVAALYGYRVVAGQGQIGAGAPATVLTQDPLVGASPLVFVLAVALAVTWSIPPAAALLFRLGIGQRAAPALEMALRRLARAPGLAVSLVRLLVVTVALGVFAATVAGVVAENTRDLALYDAGTTLRLAEWDQGRKVYAAYPLAWHRALPGVQAASLVLRLESTDTYHISTDNGVDVDLLAVDPATLGATIWWRADLTSTPLAALLAALAGHGPRAIVSPSFVAQTGLRAGDHFTLAVGDRSVPLVVAARAERFPTLNGAQVPFVVADLRYVLQRAAIPAPGEAWLRLDRSPAALARTLAAARARANTAINDRKLFEYPGLAPAFSPADSPVQAGIYGVVSTGFAIAVLFTLLGFVAHAAFAQRQRAAEFAVLRALGFAPTQLRALLLVEDVVLLVAGVTGGLLGGVLAAGLFVPYLPLAESTEIPFVVRVPWPELAAFSLGLLAVMLLVVAATASMALRRRLSGALRLGD